MDKNWSKLQMCDFRFVFVYNAKGNECRTAFECFMGVIGPTCIGICSRPICLQVLKENLTMTCREKCHEDKADSFKFLQIKMSQRLSII